MEWWNHTQNFCLEPSHFKPPISWLTWDQTHQSDIKDTSCAVEGENNPHIIQTDFSSLCKACRADGYKATVASTPCSAISRLLVLRVLTTWLSLFLNSLGFFVVFFLPFSYKPTFISHWVHLCLSLSTGPLSCSAAVTSSQTRAPWTTSSYGPMGRSRCRSWTSLYWTSGSVCLTCGRPWLVPCRSNPATASPEGASYASTSTTFLQVTSYYSVVTSNRVNNNINCWIAFQRLLEWSHH